MKRIRLSTDSILPGSSGRCSSAGCCASPARYAVRLASSSASHQAPQQLSHSTPTPTPPPACPPPSSKTSQLFTPTWDRGLEQAIRRAQDGYDDDGEDPPSGHRQTRPPGGPLSEHEYQVRLGRAIQLLRATLPDFLSIGLADYPSASSSSSSSSAPSSGLRLDPLALVRLGPPLRSSKFKTTSPSDEGAFGSVYHSDVLFEFMPSLSPTGSTESEAAANPIPGSSSASKSASQEPDSVTTARPEQMGCSDVSRDELEGSKPSFSFSGRTLYFASAHVLRTVLKALFINPHVSLDRLHLIRRSSGESGVQSSESAGHQNDELIARLSFSGTTRVTHQLHEYTVLFRYTIDRGSGQVIRHRVERIQPEIGRSLWSGFSLAWFRLAPHMYPGSVVHSSISCAESGLR
ncbi:hypothetical protein OC845_002442 [Tilletia horrida]|nr:hypothetical protein OC845_002442 [Tilletia horrida]